MEEEEEEFEEYIRREFISPEEELKLLRRLLSKISYAIIGAEYKGTDTLTKILSEIRTYGYNLGNSWPGQSFEEFEDMRIASLRRLDAL